jgi:hypothetical protein
MGFEDNFLAGLDWKRRSTDQESSSSRESENSFSSAKKKAHEFIQENALQPKDFSDVYNVDDIRHDEEYVERMKKIFEERHEEKTSREYAEIMEAIFCEQIELSDWMGPNATTIKTAEYDDIKNGTDFIVEFDEGTNSLSHLGIAVDVTFGSQQIEKKFLKIQEQILSGKLTEIKYFESGGGQYKGTLKKLARVVVGVEKPMILRLAKVWTDPSLKKDFAKHPVQKAFLLEIAHQLKTFAEYARRVNQEDIARVYENDLRVIERIIEEKKDIEGTLFDEDRVFLAIEEQLELFR